MPSDAETIFMTLTDMHYPRHEPEPEPELVLPDELLELQRDDVGDLPSGSYDEEIQCANPTKPANFDLSDEERDESIEFDLVDEFEIKSSELEDSEWIDLDC